MIERRIESKTKRNGKKKEKKNKAEEINRMQLLLSQTRKLIFSLKRSLGNKFSTIATEHTIIHFVSEVAQNNEICVEAMLFWRPIVRAKNILSIQRDKLRPARSTTHGTSGQ